MRIIFMGSPSFSVKSLEVLHLNHTVLSVYTRQSNYAGRGMREKVTAVAEFAKANNIACNFPSSFKLENEIKKLRQANVDLIVVVAFGLILPQTVLDIPRFGCINGHASLLPRWRGAAPIQRAIEAGDKQTGVTAMQMEAGLDTGPILRQMQTDIRPNDTFQTLHDRLSNLTADCLLQTIEIMEKFKLAPVMQSEVGACYANKILKSETELDLRQKVQVISNKIRAFSPIPSCWIRLVDGNRIKILEAEIKEIKLNFPLGTAILIKGNKNPGIALSEKKVLLLKMLQPAGKKRMTGFDFLNGYNIRHGEIVWKYKND